MKSLIKLLGGSIILDWIRNRVLRVPELDAPKVAEEIGITVAQLRAVEAKQVYRLSELWAKW